MNSVEPLYEIYRPRDYCDVIGQEKIARRLEMLEARNQLSGNWFWLSGPSGTGKTTIAKIVASKLADDCNVWEYDAGDLSVNVLRQIEEDWQYTVFGVLPGRVIIINEAHGLRKDVIRRMLVMAERMPRHNTVIFTTTLEGEASLFEDYDDATPLTSRCVSLSINRQGVAQKMAESAKAIAEKEGLDGEPIAKYVRLVKDSRNNMRTVLQAIGSGEMMA